MSRGGECDTHHTVTETRVTPRLSRGGGGWQCSVTTRSGVVRVRWKWYTISFVAKSSSSRVQQSYLTHTSLRKFLPRCVHSAGAGAGAGAGLRAPLYCLPMDDTFSAAAAAGSQLLTMCWLQVAATFSAQKLHAEQRSGVHNSLCWRALRWRAVRCAITTISSITSHLNPFVPVSELVLAPHFILPWLHWPCPCIKCQTHNMPARPLPRLDSCSARPANFEYNGSLN